MSDKAKSKRKKAQAGNKSIAIGGNVTSSEVHVGDTIIHSQSPTDDLMPTVSEGESPIPSSLDFYIKAPLAKLGGFFRGEHDTTRVLFAYFAAVLIYAGGIFVFRVIQHTPLPPSISDLFLYIAPGEYFYYPDWNAIAFDFILNPLAVVLSIFYHQTIFEQLSNLMRTNVLKVGDAWNRRLTSGGWYWLALGFPLILGVAAIGLSWISRYQYYVSDLLALRFYVLALIGVSTFLRTSMLVSLLHAAILLSVSAPSIQRDILNKASEHKYQRLGDSCLLINFGGLVILLYALTTIYTSIEKRVFIRSDYLFWEAVIHLIAVSLILLYFNYQQILVANYIQELKDSYVVDTLKSEKDSGRHQSVSALVRNTPNHPIWVSIRKHWFMMAFIILMALLPITLFTIGRNSH